MADFRKIETQDDLQELFKETSFCQSDELEFQSLKIDKPDADGFQFVNVEECDYMGSLTHDDSEYSGYDALFVQTLVQMFNEGKLVVLDQ